jgi:hypothetical protein
VIHTTRYETRDGKTRRVFDGEDAPRDTPARRVKKTKEEPEVSEETGSTEGVGI